MFHGKSRLRKECLQILVKMVKPTEFTDLRRAFNRIDTNKSGTIEIDELKRLVQSQNTNIKNKELEAIVNEIDINGSGVINYHEFIAAVFPVEKYATPERLRSLFEKFKSAKQDSITKRTLKDAFSKLGHNMTD